MSEPSMSGHKLTSPVGVTPEAAVSAITASRVEASLSLGRTPIGAAHSSPEICWAISGIPMASFNAAIRLRTGPDPDHHIDVIQQTFAHRSMPFIWWVTREDSQDGLDEVPPYIVDTRRETSPAQGLWLARGGQFVTAEFNSEFSQAPAELPLPLRRSLQSGKRDLVHYLWGNHT